jgi:hypothetical protein
MQVDQHPVQWQTFRRRWRSHAFGAIKLYYTLWTNSQCLWGTSVRSERVLFHAVIICSIPQRNLVTHYLWCNNIDDVWGGLQVYSDQFKEYPLPRRDWHINLHHGVYWFRDQVNISKFIWSLVHFYVFYSTQLIWWRRNEEAFART